MGTRGSRVALPEAVEPANVLPGSTYVYACARSTVAPATRSAEWWAREVFEGAPLLLRWFIVLGWRLALGLRLAPLDLPPNVMGWTLVASEREKAVLGVSSRWLTARLVILVEGDQVLHVTLVRFERAPARLQWAIAAPIHELVIPFLLSRATRAEARA